MRIAAAAPSECPTSTAEPPSRATIRSAYGSSVSAGPGSADEPPCPGNSGTSTRQRAASWGATSAQFEAAPPRPWSSATVGPLPASNQRRRTPRTSVRRAAKPGKKGLLGIVPADYAEQVHELLEVSGKLNSRLDNVRSD